MIGIQLYWISNSSGFYFIDDSCHFNYNRQILTSYSESIGSWHRLGRVWLFALPAQFGLKGTQIFSSLIFLFTIFISYKILIIKKVKFAEWIVIFIGFQPVLFNISYTVLAELPAACLIILSCYFYYKDKYVLTMLFSSFVFLFRTEYYFVAGIFLLIYLFQKKWKAIFLFAIGPVLWFLVSWIITGEYWRFTYDMLLHARLPKITEGIDWYFYFKYSPVIFGLVQTIFFISGMIFILMKKHLKDFGIILLIIAGGFVIQTLAALKGLDLTCSIGQLRYMTVVGPLFGIIAVLGLSSFLNFIKYKFLQVFSLIIFAFVMFIIGPYSTPFHEKFEIENISDQIAEIYKNKYPEYKVVSNLHYLANSLDEAASGGNNFKVLSQKNINDNKKTIIVWDSNLENSPFQEQSVPLKKIEETQGIKLLFDIKDLTDHGFDIPLHKFYKEDSKLNKRIFKFLTYNQYCWENFELKVFIKDD